jgi:hypothetical protein
MVGRVALAASAPPLSLPSDDPELWWQRVNGWGNSLAGLEASVVSPSPFLCFVYAWPVKASSVVHGPKLRRH